MSNDEVSPHVQEQIDKGLRRVFEKQAEGEIPDRLKELIAKLSDKAPDSQNTASNKSDAGDSK